jgi:hypothetical protein
MGSKVSNRVAVSIAILVFGLMATTAGAQPVDYSKNGATGTYAPQVVHKNYALNGATGDYAPAINIPKSVVPAAPGPDGRGFAWGDAAVGASAVLLIMLLVSGTALVIRRRRIPAPTPARPSAA